SAPTVGYVELARGFVHFLDFRLGQFGEITRADPVFAVFDIAPVPRHRYFTGLGLRQFRRVAGQYAVATVGIITLVVGNGQRNSFGFGELRTVTGIIALPAVRDVTHVPGEIHGS